VLDDGHLTDGLGRKINFKNCLIIMTSNLGVKKVQEFGSGIGFQKKDYVVEEQKRDTLKKELQKFFAPEFLNRIDDIIIFGPLHLSQMKQIVKIQLGGLRARLTEKKIEIEFSDYALEQLGIIGYDPLYGARPVKRVIQHRIENPLANLILAGTLKSNQLVYVDFDDEFRFEVKEKSSTQA
jgi:ATP-dependent Clp protease ATP-binding subunit ClpB